MNLSAALAERGSSKPEVLHCVTASPSLPRSESKKHCKESVLQFVFHCISRSIEQTSCGGDKPSLASSLRRARFCAIVFFFDTCLVPRGFLFKNKNSHPWGNSPGGKTVPIKSQICHSNIFQTEWWRRCELLRRLDLRCRHPRKKMHEPGSH